MPRKENEYLLLDKNDITVVCGILTTSEILGFFDNSRDKFKIFLENNYSIFQGKYVIVENE